MKYLTDTIIAGRVNATNGWVRVLLDLSAAITASLEICLLSLSLKRDLVGLHSTFILRFPVNLRLCILFLS